MRVEKVIVNRFAFTVFLQVLRFSSLHKNENPLHNFNSTKGPTRKLLKAGVVSFLNIGI